MVLLAYISLAHAHVLMLLLLLLLGFCVDCCFCFLGCTLSTTRVPFHNGLYLLVRLILINRCSVANRVLRKLAINHNPL